MPWVELFRCRGTVKYYGQQVASRGILQSGYQVCQVLLCSHGSRSRSVSRWGDLLPASAGSAPTRGTSSKTSEASAASPKTTSTPTALTASSASGQERQQQERT